MIKTKVLIINKLGLHARASAKFVSTASRFQSHIDIVKDEQTVNGKSIMAVMLLAAYQGTELVFMIEGPDEAEMEAALVKLIQEKFGEAE